METKKETSHLVSLKVKRPENFSYTAGQYCLCGEQQVALALASHPSEPLFLEFLIDSRFEKNRQILAEGLFRPLQISAPLGGFLLPELTGKTVYLVGHGSSIAALRPVIHEIRQQRNQFGPVRFIYGVRQAEDFPYPREIQDWMGSIEVYDIISSQPEDPQRWRAETGHVQDILQKIGPEASHSVALLAGSPAMIESTKNIFLQAGFLPSQILLNL